MCLYSSSSISTSSYIVCLTGLYAFHIHCIVLSLALYTIFSTFPRPIPRPSTAQLHSNTSHSPVPERVFISAIPQREMIAPRGYRVVRAGNVEFARFESLTLQPRVGLPPLPSHMPNAILSRLRVMVCDVVTDPVVLLGSDSCCSYQCLRE